MTKPSTLATQIIDDAGKLNKLIGSIKTRGATLQRDMHTAAVSCLAHVAAHSDVTLLQRFHDALPSVARTNALKTWALAMGPVRWDAKANEGKGAFRYNSKQALLIEEALATPFFEFEKEAKFKPFDLSAAIAALTKRAEAAADDDRNIVPDETLAKLRALVPAQ